MRSKSCPSFRRQIRLALDLLLLIVLASCAKRPVEPAILLPDTVSFQRDIEPIFSTNCSLSGCHISSNPKGNVDLSVSIAYSQLWKHQLVDTLHPEQSVLYIQMNSVSNPMPPTGRLPDGTIALVFKWIQQKAKNN